MTFDSHSMRLYIMKHCLIRFTDCCLLKPPFELLLGCLRLESCPPSAVGPENEVCLPLEALVHNRVRHASCAGKGHDGGGHEPREEPREGIAEKEAERPHSLQSKSHSRCTLQDLKHEGHCTQTCLLSTALLGDNPTLKMPY